MSCSSGRERELELLELLLLVEHNGRLQSALLFLQRLFGRDAKLLLLADQVTELDDIKSRAAFVIRFVVVITAIGG